MQNVVCYDAMPFPPPLMKSHLTNIIGLQHIYSITYYMRQNQGLIRKWHASIVVYWISTNHRARLTANNSTATDSATTTHRQQEYNVIPLTRFASKPRNHRHPLFFHPLLARSIDLFPTTPTRSHTAGRSREHVQITFVSKGCCSPKVIATDNSA